MSEVANWAEYQIGENEFLIVEVNVLESGLLFDFDTGGKEVYFDESVRRFSKNRFMIRFNDMSAAEAIQAMDDAIISGYLIPNGLYREEFYS